MADLVLWKPESFGARPEMVIKGGMIAWAQVRNSCETAQVSHDTDPSCQMGDANASIPTVQPVIGRPMWGAQPDAVAHNSVVWVSQASIDNGGSFSPWLAQHTELPCRASLRRVKANGIGTMASYRIKKKPMAVKRCRDIGKKDMKHNDSMPKMSGVFTIEEREKIVQLTVRSRPGNVRGQGRWGLVRRAASYVAAANEETLCFLTMSLVKPNVQPVHRDI
jgi:urease